MARLLTDEQHNFLIANAKGIHMSDMARLLNDRYSINLTKQQIKSYYTNHKITNGLNTTFKKGGTPANKGVKGVYNVGGNRTSFKPGNKPKNYRPVGSERINIDGYIEIKVSDPSKWKHKHVWVWEQVNGPVPKGHAVLLADGNKQNTSLENLILISRKQLAMLNKHKLIQDNKEGTQTGILVSDVLLKIGERKRGK